jgi:hypothetical protein
VNYPTPDEILRQARPIPTYRDHPATSACDIEGVSPDGSTVTVHVRASGETFLLLFLSADCLGCRDLWDGTAALRRDLPPSVRTVIVTRGPEHEDAGTIAALASEDVATVMSSAAYGDYRVAGAPFLVLVVGAEVLTEGVAWGVAETARAVRQALDGTS